MATQFEAHNSSTRQNQVGEGFKEGFSSEVALEGFDTI
jgi:hypothetical protein